MLSIGASLNVVKNNAPATSAEFPIKWFSINSTYYPRCQLMTPPNPFGNFPFRNVEFLMLNKAT